MSKKTGFGGLILFLAVSLLVSACNLPSGATPDGDLILTHVAQTVAAERTKQAATDQAPGATEDVPAPTLTPTPTPTVLPTIEPTPIPGACDKAVFVEHVTYPPGNLVEKGQDFVKTWRVLNAGYCTWTTDYALQFVTGYALDAPVRVALTKPVAPDQTADLSLIFTAPNAEGDFTGYWALVNEKGVKVPMDNIADGNLSVSIWVNILDTVVYDFTKSYCDARWQSVVDANLECPGDTTNSSPGYVTTVEDGKLENGKKVDGDILITRPDNGDYDGFISGTYPLFKIQRGDHFMATIGCADGATECNLFFDLQYQIGNGAVQTLKTWHEVNEGKVRKVSVDLSALANQSVRIILRVRNNETDKDNEGYWFEPVLIR